MSEFVRKSAPVKSEVEREVLCDTILDLKMKRERREIRRKKRLEKKNITIVSAVTSNRKSLRQTDGELSSNQGKENDNIQDGNMAKPAKSLTLKLKRQLPDPQRCNEDFNYEISTAQQEDKEKKSILYQPVMKTSSSILPLSRESDTSYSCSQKVMVQKSEKNQTPEELKRRLQTEQDQCRPLEWPKSSATSLPSLPSYTRYQVKNEDFCFPINEECTSLAIPPSGRHIVAGFTDGTLRLFDTTSRLWTGKKNIEVNRETCNNQVKGNTKKDIDNDEISDIFCTDSYSEAEESFMQTKERGQKCVLSKIHQNYGAVACQIHARGVNTSLLMDVACSEDGLFSFGGVLRGSTELVAVDLSGIEIFHDRFIDGVVDKKRSKNKNKSTKKQDILDLIKVYSFSDAKLKGFGACTRLKNGNHSLEYRLFTGKGIKNMHIWSFIPPHGAIKEPIWQCLYDAPTNGNSISQLHFRHDSNGLLQGITKSDDQKLRIWDLSFEQYGKKSVNNESLSVVKQLARKAQLESCKWNGRPKRPPYIDVNSTENALRVCGAYLFSGGSGMYHKMGVMSLDVQDIQSPFNHTELALPSEKGTEKQNVWSAGRSSRSSRQQRGELKSAVCVAGSPTDATHVVLELSDGSMVHYSQNGSEPSVDLLPPNLYTAPHDLPVVYQGIPCGRHMCVSLVGSEGIAVLATSSFDTNLNRGSIILRELPSTCDTVDEVPEGFWGFHGVHHLSQVVKQKEIHASNANQRSKRKKENNNSTSSKQCKETLKKRRTIDKLIVSSTRLPNPSGVIPHTKESVKKLNLSSETSGTNTSTTLHTRVKKIEAKTRSQRLVHVTDKSLAPSLQFPGGVMKTQKITGNTKKIHCPSETVIAQNLEMVSNSTSKSVQLKPVHTSNLEKRLPHAVSKYDLSKFTDNQKMPKGFEKLKSSSSNSNSSTLGYTNEIAMHHTQTILNIQNCSNENSKISHTRTKIDYEKENGNIHMVMPAPTKTKKNIPTNQRPESKESTAEIVSNNVIKKEVIQKVVITPTKAKKNMPTHQRPNNKESTTGVVCVDKKEKEVIQEVATTITPTKAKRKIPVRDVGAELPKDKTTSIRQNLKSQSEITRNVETSEAPDNLDSTTTNANTLYCPSPQLSTGELNQINNKNYDSPPRHIIADGMETPTRSLPYHDSLQNASWTPPTGIAISPDHRSEESPDPTQQKCDTSAVSKETKSSIVKYLRSRDENVKQSKSTKGFSEPGENMGTDCAKSEKDAKAAARASNRTGALRKILMVGKTKTKTIRTETKPKVDERMDLEVSKVLLSMRHQKKRWSVSPQRLINECNDVTKLPCHEPKRPKLIKETHICTPTETVALSHIVAEFLAPLSHQNERLSSVFVDNTSNQHNCTEKKDIFQVHDTVRRKMALHHRASHERLRNEVLRSVERVMNIFTHENIAQTNAKVIEGAKLWIDDTLQNYEEALSDMITVQNMEASALCATQTFESDGERAPTLHVSFPFRDVFIQARQIVSQVLLNNLKSSQS